MGKYNTKVPYDKLDEEIRKQNILRSGMALRTIYEPPDHLDLDYDALCKNLGTCVAGSTQGLLNAEAFAALVSALSPEKVLEGLQRVGVHLEWDTLGAKQPLKDLLNKRETRETSKAIQDCLEAIWADSE